VLVLGLLVVWIAEIDNMETENACNPVIDSITITYLCEHIYDFACGDHIISVII
jgi:hypothetical protein